MLAIDRELTKHKTKACPISYTMLLKHRLVKLKTAKIRQTINIFEEIGLALVRVPQLLCTSKRLRSPLTSTLGNMK